MPHAPYRTAVTSFLLAFGAASPALAQSTLRGIVREDSSGRAMAGVVISIEGTSQTTQTGPSGRYELSGLPAGTQIISLRLLGYRPLRAQVRLVAGDSTSFDARLVRLAVQQLDSLTVTGARPTVGVGLGREAAAERRSRGFGVFIGTEELQRGEHRRLSDMLRALNGVSVIRYRECTSNGGRQICGPPEERAGSRRGETSMVRTAGRDDYCWMTVFLDGSLLYKSGSSMKVPDFSRDIPVSNLDMVEVYRSAGETPTEYSGAGGTCGVILLWSKKAP